MLRVGTRPDASTASLLVRLTVATAAAAPMAIAATPHAPIDVHVLALSAQGILAGVSPQSACSSGIARTEGLAIALFELAPAPPSG